MCLNALFPNRMSKSLDHGHEEGFSSDSDSDIIEELKKFNLEDENSIKQDRKSFVAQLEDVSRSAQRSAERKEKPFLVSVNSRTFFPVFTKDGEIRLQGNIAITPARFSKPGVFRARTNRRIRIKIKKVRELEFLCPLPGEKIYRLVLVPLRLFRSTVKDVIGAYKNLKNMAVLYFPCKDVEYIEESCVVYH